MALTDAAAAATRMIAAIEDLSHRGTYFMPS
jgi:hypothetical protein